MAEGVLMPKEGITVESCIIGEWKKNVGDHVNVGDVLFTYETDKAEFECESTAAGTLIEKFYEDGDEVPCLANVCAIGKEGDAYEFLKPGAEVPAPAAAPAAVGGDALRRVVSRRQQQPVEQLLERQHLAGAQVHGRAFLQVVLLYSHLVRKVSCLKCHERRHDLRCARNRKLLFGVFSGQPGRCRRPTG